jgi:hypothetical protein
MTKNSKQDGNLSSNQVDGRDRSLNLETEYVPAFEFILRVASESVTSVYSSSHILYTNEFP